MFEQLLKENQQLTEREEGKKIIFSYIQSFIPDLPVPSNEENGIFYGNVTIQSSYFQSMKNELKHTLSSYLLLSTLNDSNRWIEREDRMFGFSKKGSILIK